MLNSTLGSVVPLAMFFCCESPSWHYVSVMMLIVMISESDSFVGSSDDLLGSRQTLPWELISVGLSCSWHLMQRWHLQKHILIFNKKFVSRALQSRPRRALSLGPFPTPSRPKSSTVGSFPSTGLISGVGCLPVSVNLAERSLLNQGSFTRERLVEMNFFIK